MPVQDIFQRTLNGNPVYFEKVSIPSGPAMYRKEFYDQEIHQRSEIDNSIIKSTIVQRSRLIYDPKKGMYDRQGHYVKDALFEYRPMVLTSSGDFEPVTRQSRAYWTLFDSANPKKYNGKIYDQSKSFTKLEDGEGFINVYKEEDMYQ